MEAEQKLCVNCKYHYAFNKGLTQWCLRNVFTETVISPVTGNKTVITHGRLFAEEERSLYGTIYCSPSAKFFEKKETIVERVIAWFK